MDIESQTQPEMRRQLMYVGVPFRIASFVATSIFDRERMVRRSPIPAVTEDTAFERVREWIDHVGGTAVRDDVEPLLADLVAVPELWVRMAPGNTCVSALRSGQSGTMEEPINDSKGCGGVMRVVPAGFVPFDDYAKLSRYDFSPRSGSLHEEQDRGLAMAYVQGENPSSGRRSGMRERSETRVMQ